MDLNSALTFLGSLKRGDEVEVTFLDTGSSVIGEVASTTRDNKRTAWTFSRNRVTVWCGAWGEMFSVSSGDLARGRTDIKRV